MAKVTITIQDKENGNVDFHSEPSFELMMKIITRSEDCTAAHVYALTAINAVREMSKKGKNVHLIIPRVRKGLN